MAITCAHNIPATHPSPVPETTDSVHATWHDVPSFLSVEQLHLVITEYVWVRFGEFALKVITSYCCPTMIPGSSYHALFTE